MNIHEEFNYNYIKDSFISVYNDTEILYLLFLYIYFFFQLKAKPRSVHVVTRMSVKRWISTNHVSAMLVVTSPHPTRCERTHVIRLDVVYNVSKVVSSVVSVLSLLQPRADLEMQLMRLYHCDGV